LGILIFQYQFYPVLDLYYFLQYYIQNKNKENGKLK